MENKSNDSFTQLFEKFDKADAEIFELPEEWAKDLQFREVDSQVFYRRIFSDDDVKNISQANPSGDWRILVMPVVFVILSACSVAWRIFSGFFIDPSDWDLSPSLSLIAWYLDISFIENTIEWCLTDRRKINITYSPSADAIGASVIFQTIFLFCFSILYSPFNYYLNPELAMFFGFWIFRLWVNINLKTYPLVKTTDWRFLLCKKNFQYFLHK